MGHLNLTIMQNVKLYEKSMKQFNIFSLKSTFVICHFFLSNSCITTIISEYKEYVFVTEASAVQQNYSDGTKTQIINRIKKNKNK